MVHFHNSLKVQPNFAKLTVSENLGNTTNENVV